MLPISIIIPCYNAAATLARTLDSCIIQPEAAQIIVVDDGSSDDSIEIVRRYGERDARIGLLQMPMNGGAARARNWAAMHATQPLLAFIDADDEYFPGALAAASGFLEQHPTEASIRLDVEYAGFPAEIVGHPQFETHAATLSNTVPSSLVIRRPVYAAFGGFPMDDFFRRNGGEDGAFSWALRDLFGNRRLTTPSACACITTRASMPSAISASASACRRRFRPMSRSRSAFPASSSKRPRPASRNCAR